METTFETIEENCQTIGDLKKLSKEVLGECYKCEEDYPCDDCISDHNDWLFETMRDRNIEESMKDE